MEGVFMMVRKLLKAAIYVKVIVVTTLVTMQEPMADEVMDEFVTSEIMEEETLAEDTEPFEEETNEELNMIATNEEENGGRKLYPLFAIFPNEKHKKAR